MTTIFDQATDGRTLIRVTFVRQTPHADSPTVEAVLRVKHSQDFTVEGIAALVPLSVTRTDTREPVNLTDEELDIVLQGAADAVARREVGDG